MTKKYKTYNYVLVDARDKSINSTAYVNRKIWLFTSEKEATKFIKVLETNPHWTDIQYTLYDDFTDMRMKVWK